MRTPTFSMPPHRPTLHLEETLVQVGMSMFVAFGLLIMILYLLPMPAVISVVCWLHLHVYNANGFLLWLLLTIACNMLLYSTILRLNMFSPTI